MWLVVWLCRLYEEGKVCLEGAKAASTGPEQAAIFDRDFAGFTAFLLQPPLYCQAGECSFTVVQAGECMLYCVTGW